MGKDDFHLVREKARKGMREEAISELDLKGTRRSREMRLISRDGKQKEIKAD